MYHSVKCWNIEYYIASVVMETLQNYVVSTSSQSIANVTLPVQKIYQVSLNNI